MILDWPVFSDIFQLPRERRLALISLAKKTLDEGGQVILLDEEPDNIQDRYSGQPELLNLIQSKKVDLIQSRTGEIINDYKGHSKEVISVKNDDVILVGGYSSACLDNTIHDLIKISRRDKRNFKADLLTNFIPSTGTVLKEFDSKIYEDLEKYQSMNQVISVIQEKDLLQKYFEVLSKQLLFNENGKISFNGYEKVSSPNSYLNINITDQIESYISAKDFLKYGSTIKEISSSDYDLKCLVDQLNSREEFDKLNLQIVDILKLNEPICIMKRLGYSFKDLKYLGIKKKAYNNCP